jgi:DNA-directed RNA polymerase subunit alpha
MVELDFKVKELTLTDEYGEFVIEPLEPGYGYTIGNALRRVLYASIPGAAVTSVRISGVKHRFSTLPGLKENIVDFLLNVKQLNLQLSGESNSATIKLSVKGDKVITAADLEVSDGVEVANTDLYLGTLSGSKSKLEMELTVEKGFGFSLADERKNNALEIIPTDAVYTPVKRVTYTVEATRVGRQTNLDKLVLKIWTNGTINPRAALDEAARLLANSFALIYQPSSSAAVEADVTDAKSTVSPEALKLTIDELDLPTRIYNSLRNGGIETVEELLNTPRKELISMRNMGGKSLAVIEDKLRTKGISLSA